MLEVLQDVKGGFGKEALRTLMKLEGALIPDSESIIYILPVKFRIGDGEIEQTHPIQLPEGRILEEIVVRAMSSVRTF